jgi:hypothetical protein
MGPPTLRPSSQSDRHSHKAKSIPAKRTSTGIARLEPLGQTARVEHMLASGTLLVWRLPVGADDRITNRTLGLAFHCACGVSSPRREAVDEAAILHIKLAHACSSS